ncbi:MAG: phosphoglycerate mutase family protein [Verrucomicrobia bacterium]|nr:phosphoglycerate mutase family protein [Verrucomicrobiota bacterium]
MATIRRIILVRCGSSLAANNIAIYNTTPNHKIGLSTPGANQVKNAGTALGKLMGEEKYGIFHSPYLRAEQSVSKLIEGIRRDPAFNHEDPRLRGQSYGGVVNQDERIRLRAIRDFEGAFYFQFPQGESLADLYDRVTAFMDTLHRRLAKDGSPTNLVVVTHARVIQAFLMRWSHSKVSELNLRDVPDYGQYRVMQVEPNSGRFIVRPQDPEQP